MINRSPHHRYARTPYAHRYDRRWAVSAIRLKQVKIVSVPTSALSTILKDSTKCEFESCAPVGEFAHAR